MVVFSFAIDFSSALTLPASVLICALSTDVAAALRFCRYAAAKAFAHAAAPGPVGASHAIVSTCAFDGTVPDFTSCASVSKFTSAPLVRLPVIPSPTSAPVVFTNTVAVAVYVFGATSKYAAAPSSPNTAHAATTHQRRRNTPV